MALLEQCVILNPKAGSAEQLALLDGLKRLGAVALFTVQAPGEATEIARQAVKEGFKRVIAAGGDGTLNEVVNGLADGFGRVQLGVIPLGTGNDFARSINVPADIARAVEILLTGQVQPLDVVKASASDAASRYFINVAAGGFSAVVDEKLQHETKKLLGPMAYAWSALKALPELQAYQLRVTLDGAEPFEIAAYNLVVANARFVAGGIPVAPHAKFDDGLLDVVIFSEMPLTKVALLLPQTLTGEHVADEDVIYYRTRSVLIESNPPFQFNTDGELAGASPATFEVLPQALEVIVAPAPAEGGVGNF